MISKEAYDYYKKYEAVLTLFNNTGQYVGGCDDLFTFMNIADKNCSTCKGQALIEAYNGIKNYECNMQSM